MADPNIQYPTFQPALRTITAITNDFPALVTTAIVHQFKTGTIVRLYVPSSFGMVQISQSDPDLMQAAITVVGPTATSNQFTIPIDTTNFDAFVIPPDQVYPSGPPAQAEYAQAIPIGEANDILIAAKQNVLPYP